MRRKAGLKNTGMGMTSMGVHYDLGNGGRPGRRRLPRAWRRWSARQRKQVINAALTALVVVGAAVFAIVIGDSLWADVPEKQPAVVAVQTAQGAGQGQDAQATAMPEAAYLAAEVEAVAEAFDAAASLPKPTIELSAFLASQAAPSDAEAMTEALVWIPASGSRYHANAACSNMQNPREVPLSQAVALGLTPCQRCNPPV